MHLVAIIMGYSEFQATWHEKHRINKYEVHTKDKYKQEESLEVFIQNPGMTVTESYP